MPSTLATGVPPNPAFKKILSLPARSQTACACFCFDTVQRDATLELYLSMRYALPHSCRHQLEEEERLRKPSEEASHVLGPLAEYPGLEAEGAGQSIALMTMSALLPKPLMATKVPPLSLKLALFPGLKGLASERVGGSLRRKTKTKSPFCRSKIIQSKPIDLQ